MPAPGSYTTDDLEFFFYGGGSDAEYQFLLDCYAAGVTAADLLALVGGGGGGAVRVEDEGTQILAAAAGINFVGAGVAVTDGGSSEATVTIPGAGGGGVTDGDKGDITVSGAGSAWAIDPLAVTTPKIAANAVTAAKVAADVAKQADLDALAAAVTPEALQDTVGAMVTGNTETKMTALYNDATGKLDFSAEVGSSDLTSAINAHTSDGSDAHMASAIGIVDTGSKYAADNVEGALSEAATDIDTVAADLGTHLGNPTDAHDASAISVVPTGVIVDTNVQAALAALGLAVVPIGGATGQHLVKTSAANHALGWATGSAAASAISTAPTGEMIETDVQAALEEAYLRSSPTVGFNRGKNLVTIDEEFLVGTTPVAGDYIGREGWYVAGGSPPATTFTGIYSGISLNPLSVGASDTSVVTLGYHQWSTPLQAFRMEVICRKATADDASHKAKSFIGLAVSVPAVGIDPGLGVWFIHNPDAGANWLLKVCDTGLGSDVFDTGIVVVAGTYHKLGLEHDGAGNFHVEYNSVAVAGSPFYSAKYPQAGATRFGPFLCNIKSLGTGTAKALAVDRFYMQYELDSGAVI